MFDNSCIVFDHPNKNFVPGDLVTGKVVFTTLDPISARFLRISWKGESTVSFSRIEECNSKKYLSDYFMAWHAKPGMKELPSGEHRYRFSFKVPQEAPPTFDGSFGKIEYCVEVELNRAWRFNTNVKKEFNVVHKTDVQNIPISLLKPVNFSNHRESGTVFKNGMFSLKVKLRKQMYLPGDTIKAVIEMHNNCERAIVHLQCELVQQSHFHSRTHDTTCTIKRIRQCPLDKKYQKTSEKILQCGSYPIAVPPFRAKQMDVEIDVPKHTVPSFESVMVSVGYLLCVGIKTTSLTGNKLECNARISVGSLEKGKKKRRRTIVAAPAPAPAPDSQQTPTRPARFPNFFSEPPRPKSYELDAPPPYDPSWSVRK